MFELTFTICETLVFQMFELQCFGAVAVVVGRPNVTLFAVQDNPSFFSVWLRQQAK